MLQAWPGVLAKKSQALLAAQGEVRAKSQPSDDTNASAFSESSSRISRKVSRASVNALNSLF